MNDIEILRLLDQEAERTQRASVVCLQKAVPSFPTILSLWLHRQAGELAPDYQIFAKGSLTRIRSPRGEGFATIFPLDPESVKLIENLPAEQRWLVGRLANYARNYPSKSRGDRGMKSYLRKLEIPHLLHDTFAAVNLRYLNQPELACKEGLKIIDYFVANGLDPFRTTEIAEFGDYLNLRNRRHWLAEADEALTRDEERAASVGDYGEFTVVFPELVRDPEGKLRPGETSTEELNVIIRLPLGRLKLLEGERISIVIVGRPGSGKSTLAASLAWKSQEFLDAIRRHAMPDLALSTSLLDLDVWTPDASNILGVQIPRKTKPWSEDTAAEQAQGFLDTSRNIIIADAPGMEPNLPGSYTRQVVFPADCALVLTKSWEEQNIWRSMLQELGIRPVGFIASRPKGEVDGETPIDSAITRFFYDRATISGRVVGLDRNLKKEDNFLNPAVPLLLLHILPEIILRRRKQKRTLINVIKKELSYA